MRDVADLLVQYYSLHLVYRLEYKRSEHSALSMCGQQDEAEKLDQKEPSNDEHVASEQ
jgi:hypothetical protein